jgi:hypothetical protein
MTERETAIMTLFEGGMDPVSIARRLSLAFRYVDTVVCRFRMENCGGDNMRVRQSAELGSLALLGAINRSGHKEPVRPARTLSFAEQLAAVGRGQGLKRRFVPPRTEPAITLGGVSAGML